MFSALPWNGNELCLKIEPANLIQPKFQAGFSASNQKGIYQEEQTANNATPKPISAPTLHLTLRFRSIHFFPSSGQPRAAIWRWNLTEIYLLHRRWERLYPTAIFLIYPVLKASGGGLELWWTAHLNHSLSLSYLMDNRCWYLTKEEGYAAPYGGVGVSELQISRSKGVPFLGVAIHRNEIAMMDGQLKKINNNFSGAGSQCKPSVAIPNNKVIKVQCRHLITTFAVF